MDQLVLVAPLPTPLVLMPPFAIDIVNYTANRNPNHRRHQHYGADNVIAQEQQHLIDVNVLDYIPEPFHDVLNSFLAVTLQNGH